MIPLPLQDDLRRRDRGVIGPLGWLRIVGLALLLSYPLISFVAVAEFRKPYIFLAPVLGSAAAFLSFVCFGAGFRAGGSVVRGGLAGAGLYLLLGAAISAFWWLRVSPPPDLAGFLYLGLGWPIAVIYLFGGGG